MFQLPMFDRCGKPTDFAMRYVKPRSYSVGYVNSNGRKCGYLTLNVHKAIKCWLEHPGSHIVTRW
jgi:hypothetical protein